MPIEPPHPGVPVSFLDEVARCTWRDERLVDRSGVVRYLAVVDGRWTLSTSGYLLSENTYRTLLGARANEDGSFTDATGVTRRLSNHLATIV